MMDQAALESPQPDGEAFEEFKNLLLDLRVGQPLHRCRMPSEATRRSVLQLDRMPKAPSAARMEAHLKAVYKHEVCSVFDRACHRLLFESQTLKGDLYEQANVPRRFRKDADWNQRATSILETIPEGTVSEQSLETVRLLTSGKCLTLGQVAQAGSQLMPLPKFQVYQAQDAMARCDYSAAHLLLSEVFHKSPFGSSRLDAACNLGAVAFAQGCFDEAVNWYRIDALSDSPWALSGPTWLYIALTAGSAHQANDALCALVERQLDDPIISEFCHRLHANRFASQWAPSKEATALARSIKSPNETVQKILNAFL